MKNIIIKYVGLNKNLISFPSKKNSIFIEYYSNLICASATT